jgi:branched-subunit amino acid transport protein
MDDNNDKSKLTECEIGMTAIEKREIGSKKKKVLSFKPNKVLQGIIYSEILGKPKGRKGLVK